MPTLRHLTGLEILDSRGRPTVKAACALASGATGTASVPAGASTGAGEAQELRDGDPGRYAGLGCQRAVAALEDELGRALAGQSFESQAAFDEALIACDGTPRKSRCGANALLAASLAFARAAAAEEGAALYAYLASVHGGAPRLPRPIVNLFSGGKHAGGQVPIQDVLLVPVAATSMDQALATVFAVYQAAARLVRQKYGARPLVADEGGLAPDFPDAEAMLGDAVDAIAAAGLRPGQDVALAVDVASTHFFAEGRYALGAGGQTSAQMIDTVAGWVDRFPILGVEDGLAEDDWAGWPALCQRIGGRALVVGDDLLCTDPARVARAAQTRAANALLLKVNQIGTLTEAAAAERRARAAGWFVIASARSGETEDDWLADLAVGWAADQIKIGSITRSERLAKYNRLLEIEATRGLPMAPAPSPR